MARATVSRKSGIFEPIRSSSRLQVRRRRRDHENSSYARDSNPSEADDEDVVSSYDDESDAYNISHQRHAKWHNSQSDDGNIPSSCLD
ncbi:hypothetical protein BJY52DRAFT_1191567 [Lactarius psammicola]|nr:hypothetical protein BJY52DRAFT_1191567 [Lactarius psammicola]